MIFSPFRHLEKALGYRFRRKSRLETALTHPSYRHETDGVEEDNQRLEFLGDAALALAAAEHLYERHPNVEEGELTRMRSRIASARALAKAAAAVGIGEFLRLGRGELAAGGRARESSLADAFEAVLGAAYDDGGLPAVRKILSKNLWPMLEDGHGKPWADNPKGYLQEWAQERTRANPQYAVTAQDGPAHACTFAVEVRLKGHALGQGRGGNKRDAETSAALDAISRLDEASRLFPLTESPTQSPGPD